MTPTPITPEALAAAETALPIARSDLERLFRVRADLQAVWEQQATDIAVERLTTFEQDKLDYSGLLEGITQALDAHFFEAIEDAREAVSRAENIIEEASWDAEDAAMAEELRRAA